MKTVKGEDQPSMLTSNQFTPGLKIDSVYVSEYKDINEQHIFGATSDNNIVFYDSRLDKLWECAASGKVTAMQFINKCTEAVIGLDKGCLSIMSLHEMTVKKDLI